MDFSKNYYELEWDLAKPLPYILPIGVKDDNSNGFKVKILQNGELLTPTTETLRIYIVKHDGNPIFDDFVIQDGLFTIELDNQVFAVEGDAECQLRLSSGSNIKYSTTFIYKIGKNLIDGSIESTPEYIAFENGLATIDTYNGRLTDVENNKANQVDLDTTNTNVTNLQTSKADKSYTDTQLLTKSDKTYVDTQLNLKANQTSLNSTNANVSSLTTSKANQSDVDTINSQITNINTNKVDKNGSGQVTYAMLAQDARTAMTGGSAAVVGINGVLQGNIVDGSVLPRKTIMFNRGSGNLFDKSTARNGYVNASGYTSNSGWYCSLDFVDCYPNNPYTVYLSNTNNGYLTFYTADKVFIQSTNFSGSSGNYVTITSPANAYFIIPNITYTLLNTFTLVQGSTGTSNVLYTGNYKLKPEYTPDKISNIYTVSLDGRADYTSIQSACNAAPNGSTIYIYPGEYVEAIDIKDKTLNLIGVNKEITRIVSTNDSREYPPLEISSGVVKNLTFYAKRPTGAPTPSYATPYGVHIDYDQSANKSLVFENCYFRSDWNASVGIGMRVGFTLTFRNCEFTSTYSDMGAVFFHDSSSESLAGTYYLIIDTCKLSSSGAYSMVCMGIGYAGNQLNLYMTRNILYCDGNGVSNNAIGVQTPSSPYPVSTGTKFMGTNTIFLNYTSFGNNIPICNA